uniref:Uncharacterized protein n=1 Tax=Salarias fasciatus TaxID=181472 RepID=A0A672GYJ7_SALFA
MLFSPALCLVSLLLFTFVEPGCILSSIKERVRDARLQKSKQDVQKLLASGHQPSRHVKEAWIRQPLDHFNRQDTKTFAQKFFVNEAHWRRPDGPVFLYIGGEGPLFDLEVMAGTLNACLHLFEPTPTKIRPQQHPQGSEKVKQHKVSEIRCVCRHKRRKAGNFRKRAD